MSRPREAQFVKIDDLDRELVDNQTAPPHNRNLVASVIAQSVRSLRSMLRRLKPLVACGMLVLYAGMMLLGESLHGLLGCEHAHGPTAVATSVNESPTEGSVPAVAASVEDEHDADACPLCQFHAQGQLAPNIGEGQLEDAVVVTAPCHSRLVDDVCALTIHAPRPPPRV